MTRVLGGITMGGVGPGRDVSGHPESEWIREAQKGDRAAYDRLVQKYRKQVYRWAYHLVRTHDLADEVTQDVFVRTYQALERLDPDRPLGAWLCRSTTNIALNLLRKHQFRTRWVEENRPETPSTDKPASQPDAAYRSQRLVSRIQRAIDSLPPMYRAVILLRIKEEMSYEEIAEALGVSIGTVMSRLARARQKLRNILGDIMDELRE
jgi:RNA polymerase sigma-70 factor (ECF subfamily)